MKVSICFTGHLRTFEKCKESFEKNILDEIYPNIPDIFFSVYDREDLNSNKYYTKAELNDILYFNLKNGDKLYPKIINVIDNDKYQQDRINVETTRLLNNNHSLRHISNDFLNLSGITRNILDTYNRLLNYEKENNINYDLFMFTRPDMLHNEPKNIINSLIPYTLNIFYSTAPDPCDEVVLGNRKNISIYVSRYDNMIKCINEHTWIGAASPCAHIMLRYCLARYGSPCKDCLNNGETGIYQNFSNCRHWNWENIGTVKKCKYE